MTGDEGTEPGSAGRWGAHSDPAADEVHRHVDLTTPHAVRIAATMRLSDLLRDGPRTVAGLATATGSVPSALRRVLAHLETMEYVTLADNGSVRLGRLGPVLFDDHPSGLRDRLDTEGAFGRLGLATAGLLSALRGTSSAYDAVHGAPFWEDIESDPDRWRSFHESMARSASWVVPVLARHVELRSIRRVVDVGGGLGATIADLLASYAHLRGTVVDLPATVPLARDYLSRRGVEDRVDVVGQDFRRPLPEGGDLYLLSMVVHDHDDEVVEEVLTRCHDAMADAASVVVVEFSASPTRHPWTATSVDLELLASGAARQRTLDEHRALLRRGGFRRVEAIYDDDDLVFARGWKATGRED